jgi:hypothetical protein
MKKLRITIWAAVYFFFTVVLFGIAITLASPELDILHEEGKAGFLNFSVPALIAAVVFLLTYRKAKRLN